MDYVMWSVLGYISGSIMYAYLLPKLLVHVDIRQLSDDGNPGTANAFKYAGTGVGTAVVFCELAKGFLPVYLAAGNVDPHNIGFAAVMAAPVLGHAFPIWHRIKGGKAIAVSFGVMIGLLPETNPLFLLIFFYLLFSLVIIIKPHLYRSVITFLLFGAGSFLCVKNHGVKIGCMAVSVIVAGKHFEKYKGEQLSVQIRRKKVYPIAPKKEEPVLPQQESDL